MSNVVDGKRAHPSDFRLPLSFHKIRRMADRGLDQTRLITQVGQLWPREVVPVPDAALILKHEISILEIHRSVAQHRPDECKDQPVTASS